MRRPTIGAISPVFSQLITGYSLPGPDRQFESLVASTIGISGVGDADSVKVAEGANVHVTVGEIIDSFVEVAIFSIKVGEIVDQVVQVQKRVDREQRRISNIVFMGMGEPLDNLDALVKAIEILKYDDGLQFSSRRITVSTCGLVPGMEKLGRLVDVCLAVSLNATEDETRSRLMPVNRRYNLEALLAACRHFPLKRRSRITFEYILIKDVNDRLEDAVRLVKLMKPLKSKINLIPFNEHPDLPFRRPSAEQVSAFQAVLLDSGMTSIIRKSKGADIAAACGQLRGKVAADDE